IACTIELPDEPMGQTFDLDEIDVTFEPSPNAPLQSFEQVPGIADCLPGAKQFFVENGSVELCPDACATVTNGVSDGEVKVDVHCVLEP
ncbi:MAG: hypothetical protein JRI68_28770, partial [Deltaproteobacteria bacterium]|nr:hypothetical protein [Deltaproteobacteria bacterium]